MLYKIDWQDTATEDLKQIRAYLEQFSVETANRILSQLVDQANSLENFPARCRLINKSLNLRRLVVADYSVFYRIMEDKRLVQLHHIWHQSRDIATLDVQ